MKTTTNGRVRKAKRKIRIKKIEKLQKMMNKRKEYKEIIAYQNQLIFHHMNVQT
jgi:hypothetical protein